MRFAWASARRADSLAQVAWLTERTASWVCTWGQYLAQADGEAIGRHLRRHENTGRPLGDKPFVLRVGQALGRNLLPGKVGRPKKDSDAVGGKGN